MAERAPRDDAWAHEIKADGYRLEVHTVDGHVTIYTRRGRHWTDRLAPIASAARLLKVWQVILDGEAVVLAKSGVTDLHALRREIGKRQSAGDEALGR